MDDEFDLFGWPIRPKVLGRMQQGQGATTEFKQRGIHSAEFINMKVCSQAGKYHSRFSYHHLDLHCGCGINEKAGCDGSPLVFLAAARAAGKENYRAHFCDRNVEFIKTLESRTEIRNNERCFLYPANNREVLAVFAQAIRANENPRYAMGSILCDPNGWFFDTECPVVELAKFCADYPRIDLILNLNARTFQLMRPHVKRGNGKWKSRTLLGVSDLPSFLSRKHWLIRGVLQKGGDRFVLLIGRNYRINENPGFGFYHLDSPRGQRIVEGIEKCTIEHTDNTWGTLCFE